MSSDEPILLDDATILGWIEGELAPERHRMVTRAIAQEPALQKRADAMRLDRFTLRALGDERAPAGLLDGVADLLERDMLVSIGDGLFSQPESIGDGHSPATDPRPLDVGLGVGLGEGPGGRKGGRRDGFMGGVIVHDRETGLRRVRRERDFRPLRYAFAAGLLIAVGAGAWFGGMMSVRDRRAIPREGTTIARAEPGGTPGEIESGASAGVAAVEAMRAELVVSAVEAVPEDGPARADVPMTIERARELLLERRLVVRARMADLSGLAWIDGVSERVALERDVPAELALAVAPTNAAGLPTARESSLLLAGDASVGPPIELTMRDEPALPERVAASIVLVRLDAQSLEEAIRGLRAQRGIVAVELEEADAPLPGLDDGAQDTFWWRESSDRWTPSAVAPIVFEVLR